MVESKEQHSFTYADLYSDCFRYLGINDPSQIRKMTIAEYMALRKGAILRTIDMMEMNADQAYKTAISGAYDKDGKPIIRNFKDLFDRKKTERLLLEGIDPKRAIDPKIVENFTKSKQRAEDAINGIKFERRED